MNRVNNGARVIQWCKSDSVFSLDHGAISVWPQTLAKQPLPLRSWSAVSWVDFALMCAEIWRTWLQECDEVRSSETADGTGVPLSALLWSHQGRPCFSPWMWVYLAEVKRRKQNSFGLRSPENDECDRITSEWGSLSGGVGICVCVCVCVTLHTLYNYMHAYMYYMGLCTCCMQALGESPCEEYCFYAL